MCFRVWRCRGLVIAVVSLTACAFNVDYTGTLFECGANGACPTNQVCREQRCVATPQSNACSIATAAGANHTCAVRTDGTAWCWGRNDFGQLGDNTTIDSSTPVQVSGIRNAIAIAAGETHSCAVERTGEVRCWGQGSSGQLGDSSVSSSAVPVVAALLEPATAIAAGDSHSCAILADQTVACWGAGDHGQLGGQPTSRQPAASGVPGILGATAIAAGGASTCAVDGNHALWCWGDDTNGQLGDNMHVAIQPPTKITIPGNADVVSVAVGTVSSCALSSDGAVFCSGDTSDGELGVLTTAGTAALLPAHAAALAVGDHSACAVDDQHQLWCWGDNADRQLADIDSSTVAVPLRTGATGIAAVTAGGGHVCATASDGGIACSGFNGRGELGNGKRTAQSAPQPVLGPNSVVSLAAGDEHTCAVLADQTVVCWGNNDSGQLGDGTLTSRAIPVPVQGVHGAVLVAAGAAHSCALLADRTVQCWGRNNFGQLGDGTFDTRSAAFARVVTPALDKLTGVTQLVAGGDHTCAVSGGSVLCWGNGGNQQLGGPAGVSGYAVQLAMLPGPNPQAVAITAGATHTCAVTGDDTAVCWGSDDHGEVGDGNPMFSAAPSAVAGLVVDQISAGFDFTCAHKTDGTVACWGDPGNGRLGIPAVNGGVPITVMSIPSVAKVVAGGSHACALTATGSVGGPMYCWGNPFADVANGAGYTEQLPTMVTGLSNAIDAAAGLRHVCALLADHSVRCWGDDRQGQLGDGESADQAPVAPLLDCPPH